MSYNRSGLELLSLAVTSGIGAEAVSREEQHTYGSFVLSDLDLLMLMTRRALRERTLVIGVDPEVTVELFDRICQGVSFRQAAKELKLSRGQVQRLASKIKAFPSVKRLKSLLKEMSRG